MATRVLFRVDAGPTVGIGHLQRCIALALALGQLGADTAFLAPADDTVRGRLQSFGFEHIASDPSESGGASDLRSTISAARARGCDALVVDAYEPNAGFLAGLQESMPLVVAVDDMAPFPFPCRLVINGNGDAQTLDYRSTGSDTRFLLGTEYALLRPEFCDLPIWATREEVGRVLVTTGGGDQHGLLPRVIGWLDEVPGDFQVACVLGPVTPVTDEAERAAAQARRAVTLVRGPSSMYELMLDADIAISAGGQTLYELAATGTPTVVVQVAGNQAGNIEALSGKGVIRFLGAADEPGLAPRLGSTMTELVSVGGIAERRRMSLAGRTLVDGRGAERAARELVALSKTA